jgi:hypothetical protein
MTFIFLTCVHWEYLYLLVLIPVGVEYSVEESNDFIEEILICEKHAVLFTYYRDYLTKIQTRMVQFSNIFTTI